MPTSEGLREPMIWYLAAEPKKQLVGQSGALGSEEENAKEQHHSLHCLIIYLSHLKTG
jgi:hypothetical protein